MKEGIPIPPGEDGYWRMPHILTIQDFLKTGTLENYHVNGQYLWNWIGERSLNLGPGMKMIGDSIPVGYHAHVIYDNGVDWQAGEELPFDTESVQTVYAVHFLEHLTMRQFYRTMHECERVLVPGGQMFIVVPYGTTDFALRAPDHQLRFTENTWRTMFENPYAGDTNHRIGYYVHDQSSADGWDLEEVFSMIAGTCAHRMCLYTILQKKEG